jgi:hypothetical protein
MVAEGHEGTKVRRHRVVLEEAGDPLLEPFRLFANGPMQSSSQFFLRFLEHCPQAVAPALPVDQELAGAGLADESEAQDREGFRLAEPAPRAIGGGMTAELDEAGLVRGISGDTDRNS